VLTAFSRYNTGSPTRGFRNGYVQRVVAKTHPLDLEPVRQAESPERGPNPAAMPEPAMRQSWQAFERAQPSSVNAFPSERGR